MAVPAFSYKAGTNLGVSQYGARVVSGYVNCAYVDKDGVRRFCRRPTYGKALWIWTGYRWVRENDFVREARRDQRRAERGGKVVANTWRY